MGVPADVVEIMFSSFYSKRRGGTGLGLAYCHSGMQSFNGQIQAESIEKEFMHIQLIFPKPRAAIKDM